ncbi:metallophosphoesterase family protein [Flexibacterium corallicola]|uniref:metallophosphoesterase family protein n=1 Tax=Flexibacterium corallicola TaxID=3037259 RepID=UPI00286F8DA1|nr:metallophosphoesterase [Pseudovibrio sp. M1P-2-3]
MFKLIHLSDPHLGPLPAIQKRQLASKRILGYINWQRNRAHSLTSKYLDGLLDDIGDMNPDHIALCGDLVNIALPAEIATAREWLKIVGSPELVSVVPGNHDAYVPGAVKSAFTSWRPYMTSDEEQGHIIPHSKDLVFPFIRRRKELGIIGLSTARATGPFMATGYMSNLQLRDLKTNLLKMKSEGLFRVVMLHHPPVHNSTSWHKRFVGASRFRNVIAECGAELILHGHTHYATKLSIAGPDGDVPVICVPSASNGPGHKKPPACYNLFEIKRKPSGWHCKMTERGYTEDKLFVHTVRETTLSIPYSPQ